MTKGVDFKQNNDSINLSLHWQSNELSLPEYMEVGY